MFDLLEEKNKPLLGMFFNRDDSARVLLSQSASKSKYNYYEDIQSPFEFSTDLSSLMNKKEEPSGQENAAQEATDKATSIEFEDVVDRTMEFLKEEEYKPCSGEDFYGLYYDIYPRPTHISGRKVSPRMLHLMYDGEMCVPLWDDLTSLLSSYDISTFP